jgi:murein DD-endopeptidase MepM/ murein hydrolase activator NlpD
VNRVGEIMDRMRVAAGVGQSDAQPDKAELKRLATEFESMLLVQMLRDMRQSGKWDTDSPEEGGLGAETFFETLDVELAGYLARNKGLGLSAQLEEMLAKGTGTSAAAARVEPAVSVPRQPVSVDRPAGAAGSSVPDAIGSTLKFSVAPASITSSFGWRQDPFTGQAKFHRGIDVRASYGQEVQAAGEGRVVFSGEQRGYGTTVLIEHANGFQTRYAHLSATVVQEGQTVSAGQVVGRAGRSGRATGTHLHFEVTKDGKHVSPAEAGLVE